LHIFDLFVTKRKALHGPSKDLMTTWWGEEGACIWYRGVDSLDW